jgi:multicomponent Na+:H+ antiporter subunit G
MIINGLVILSLLIGCVFFIAGTVGVLRMPDVYSRLHALTKADNAGLGFIILGLALHNQSWVLAMKLALIWLLVLLASSVACHLVARTALQQESRP